MEDLGVDVDFWRGRRVFVTGHTGFKGSWLCLRLWRLGASIGGYSDGIPTHPSLFEEATVDECVTSVVGDVRDHDALRDAVAGHRPEIVFHLAAQPLVRRSFAEPALTFDTNVLGTVNLLEAVRSVDTVRAAVVITTDKVYEHVRGRPYREGDRLGGSDPYSSSKACAELVVAAYRDSFFAEERSPAVASARAGNVIGGGDWAADRVLPDLIAALSRREPVTIRYPDAVRPWQHVLDPLEGYLVLAQTLWRTRSAAGAWNFGPSDSDAQPVAAVVRRVSELWGEELQVDAPQTPQPPESPSLLLDSARARDELGWRPRWDFDEALRATVDWYRNYVSGRSARELTLAQIDAHAAAATACGERS